MKNSVFSTAAVCCAVLLVGCSEDETHPVEPSPTKAPTNEVVFVRANGWDLTASSISNAVMIRARIAEIQKRPIPKDKFPFWANQFAMGSAAGMLQSHLLEEELLHRGIARTAESDLIVIKRYNKLLRGKFASEDELSKKFGELEPAFRAQFDRESLFESFFSTSPECAVTDADIAGRYHQLSNRLARAERANVAARKKADLAMKRLAAGEAWDVVASNVTEDALIEVTYADNWQNWGNFKLKDLECEQLITILPTLKNGDFTSPIETDEGLIIVKLLEKDGDFYSLARILFRMGVEVEFPEREELCKILRQEKRTALQRKLLPELRSQAKIEYPLGTNFVYKIWVEPELTPEQRQSQSLLRRFNR